MSKKKKKRKIEDVPMPYICDLYSLWHINMGDTAFFVD